MRREDIIDEVQETIDNNESLYNLAFSRMRKSKTVNEATARVWYQLRDYTGHSGARFRRYAIAAYVRGNFEDAQRIAL